VLEASGVAAPASASATGGAVQVHDPRGVPLAGVLALALGQHRAPHLVELHEQWREAGHDALGAVQSHLTYTTSQYLAHLEWLHQELAALISGVLQREQ
jgi:hypothetical protein